MRRLLAALVTLCATFALAPTASADRFTLIYDGVGLGFVPLGEIRVDAEVADDRYRISANLESRGLLNLFERTRLTANASGMIQDNGGVHWRTYELDHHYSRKHRAIAMEVAADGAVNTEIVPNYRLWGDPPASDAQQRRSRDPLSNVVAMSIDVGQSRRCSGVYPTFDGRFHYLLELSGAGEVRHFEGGGYEGPVLRCRLAYIAVSGFEQRDAGRRRIPEGEIWFALMPDTTFAPVVRIATPLSAGGAVIRLSRMQRARVDVELTSAGTP